MIRKHVKVEPDRWYYWCDKLGLLVWQDMPSALFKRDARLPSLWPRGMPSSRRELEGRHRRAPQPPVDRHVGAVQRRLGPVRHGAHRGVDRSSYDPTPAGQQRERLDRPGRRRRPRHAQLPRPRHAAARRRTGRRCWASSAGSACRSPATSGRPRGTGATATSTTSATYEARYADLIKDLRSARRQGPGRGGLHPDDPTARSRSTVS